MAHISHGVYVPNTKNMKNETKNCQNCKVDFVIEQDDFNFYEKMKVPPPTFCPLCRAQRRFVLRNERNLFKVKNAFTGNTIFSLYPEESERRIITRDEWYGDGWNGTEYAQDYNFTKVFFEQIVELTKKVLTNNLHTQRMINSPYCANGTALKNCYLCFNSNSSEDCMYGNAFDFCKDCIDNSHINHSERCYESFWLQNCYQCYFTIMSADSRNLYFCRDCLGCNDCVGCVNLRKSSFCIFNKQYSREDYFVEIEKMRLNTSSGIKQLKIKSREFWKTQPVKSHQGLKNLNSTGSYVTNCRNVNNSFLVRDGENMRYCQYLLVPQNKDNYDVSIWGENTELNYETVECGENSYNNKFCKDCWSSCRDNEYCMHLFSCENCFGCVGLKKKQFCILNKQYTKEEYFNMIEKIKNHMNEMPYFDKKGNIYRYGEFFPIEISPYGYNNTIAMQHFSLTKESAQKNGYPWYEVPRGEYKITKKSQEIPDLIDDINNEILQEVFECENCKNAYRVLENEFLFYKKENLPIPHICNDCRYDRRLNDRLKIDLYDRKCMCVGDKDETGTYINTIKHIHGNELCGEIFKTGYSPDGEEIVYCEKCYQQEVY